MRRPGSTTRPIARRKPRGRTLGEPTPPPAADGAPRRPPDGSAAACHACPSVPHALRTERPSRGGARAGPGVLAAVGPRSRAGGVLRTALIRTVGTLVCSGSRGRLSRSPGSPKTDGGAGCTPTPRDADTCPWNAFCCSQVSTSRRNGAVHARLPRDSCERRVWRLRDAALPSERALAAAGRLPARARRPMSLAGHPVTGRWPPRAQEVAVSALRTREPVTALRRGWPTSPAPQFRAELFSCIT